MTDKTTIVYLDYLTHLPGACLRYWQLALGEAAAVLYPNEKWLNDVAYIWRVEALEVEIPDPSLYLEWCLREVALRKAIFLELIDSTLADLRVPTEFNISNWGVQHRIETEYFPQGIDRFTLVEAGKAIRAVVTQDPYVALSAGFEVQPCNKPKDLEWLRLHRLEKFEKGDQMVQELVEHYMKAIDSPE